MWSHSYLQYKGGVILCGVTATCNIMVVLFYVESQLPAILWWCYSMWSQSYLQYKGGVILCGVTATCNIRVALFYVESQLPAI